MRWMACIVLVACGAPAKPAPAPWRPPGPIAEYRGSRPEPQLALDDQKVGRLIYSRDGDAWDVHCDGKQLTKRPWQGGPARPAGPCRRPDADSLDLAWYWQDPIAIAGDRTAWWTAGEPIHVSKDGTVIRTIPISRGFTVQGLAFDGDAIVVVVRRTGGMTPGDRIAGVELPTAIAALVRVESEQVTTKELVAYLSTGPGVDPTYVAAGPERLLLMSRGASVVSCDYRLRCDDPTFVKTSDPERGMALGDGSIVVFKHEGSVSLIDPTGALAWSTTSWVYKLYGSTGKEIWIAALEDWGKPLQILALDRITGKLLGPRGYIRDRQREELGRYLEISGIAPTPAGPVVRGQFGGWVRAGSQELTAARLRATCYWRTPHDGEENSVPFEAKCQGRFKKAIFTERPFFVATNAWSLDQ